MARDIEDFLRRAAERRKQQQGGGGAQPPQQQQPRPAQPGPAPPRQQQPPPRRLVIEEAQVYEQADVVEPIPQRPRSVISDHVRQYVDSSDIADHAEHLGERLSQTDERLEARLKRKFGRDLSRLDDRPSVQDPDAEIVVGREVGSVARDLLELFQSPESMRQAILVSEIMKRPDFD
ncbi:MAG: hypothetical protein AAF456_04845 [Planctomycetota bacterium]